MCFFTNIGSPLLLILVRPVMTETTALGAAIAAGSAEGINVWNISEVEDESSRDIFYPSITEDGKCKQNTAK